MNKHAWIIYNGHLSGDKFKDFAEWIEQSGRNQGITSDIIKNNHLLTSVSQYESTIMPFQELNHPDFVVFADKDIPLARQLEFNNIPVFNSANAIEMCDNKISTYQQLAKHQLPIPKTIFGPKIYPGVQEIDVSSFMQIENHLDYPVIVKEAYGSFGEQVYLIDSRQALFKKIKELKGSPFVIQEFIETSYGKDVRLNVVGDQVIASMLRKSYNDFRANVSAGGIMEPYEPSEQEKKIAIATCKAVGADFAGVDLLFGKNNEPVICEVNSNAHIRNIFDCTQINVADYIIDYILKTRL